MNTTKANTVPHFPLYLYYPTKTWYLNKKLPIMWVNTYKFREGGEFSKHLSRPVSQTPFTCTADANNGSV